MKIPKIIRGYGYVYKVIQKKDLRDRSGRWDGMINYKEKCIKLRKNVHHSDREQSLLHEIVHLVSREERIGLEEKEVDSMARGLYQILKDSKLLK